MIFELCATLTLKDLDEEPYSLLRRLREREPVTWCSSIGCWLVTAWELAAEVLTSPDRFTVEEEGSMVLRILGSNMLSRDGDPHRRHRGAFDPALRFRPVRDAYTKVVRSTSEALVSRFEARGSADLRAEFARLLPVEVMGAVLGLDGVEAPRLSGWYDEFAVALGNYGRDPAIERRGLQTRGALEEVVLSRVPTALVAEAHASGSLSDLELAHNVAVLLFGGVETTESLVLNCVWALLRHPEQLAEVRADSELLPRAVEESLRWESPVQILDRWAVEDTSLGGVPIARGDQVNVMVAAVNRDPAVFSDPDRFDIHRENVSRHMAFGHGPHLCVGFNLARLEGQIAVATLLDRLPNLRLDPAQPTNPRGHAFRKPPHLHVRWGGPD